MSTRSGLAIERVAETGSTNSDLLERVRALAAAGDQAFAPCVLVATRQRAGRGRHGRTWHAQPGASLTFSLAWHFAREDLSGLSLAVGAALADSLDATGAGRIGLKWPNDLWLIDDRGHSGSHDGRVPAMLPGRKLAGVLIETTPYGADRVAVIGVGVNVLSQQVDEAASGCACWAEIEPQATPETTLARVLDPLADALGRFQREGFAAFAARYAARDLLRGRCIAAAGAHGPIEGVACGVSAGGELLLQTARGVVAIGSGEVRLRLLPTGQAAPPARQRAGSPTC